MPRPGVLLLRAANYRRQPWKNGRGLTEEIAIHPSHANFSRGDFDWRVSRARIDESGRFSPFPGFARVLVVTAGMGLTLEHGASAPRARLRPFEPHGFDGDWDTRGELVDGPVADFNVLTRRERFESEVGALRLGARRWRESFERGSVLLHVVDGPAIARFSGEDEPFVLAPGDSLFADRLGRGDELDVQSEDAHTALVWVHLREAAPR